MFVSAVIRAELLANGKPAPTGVEGQWSAQCTRWCCSRRAASARFAKWQLVQIPGTPASAEPEGDDSFSPCP